MRRVFRNNELRVWALLGSLVLVGACKEVYDPELSATEERILVVEGYLDTDGVPSELSLSYTVGTQEEVETFPAVTGARVHLESSSGQRYELSELGQGKYGFAKDIPENEVYNLKIQLINGYSYTSEELKPLASTDILDIGFEKSEEGVEIFITTQGNEQVDNFLWTYEETWAFKPPFPNNVKYDIESKNVVERSPEEKMDLCYLSIPNSDLVLESSSRFEDNLVFKQRIREIAPGDERLTERYSILVTQKALTPNGAEFWEILRRNTDDIGTIFSPLPTQIRGNMVHDQDPDTPVIGHVGLGKVSQKRLFIDITEVYPWQADVPEYFGCSTGLDTVFVQDYEQEFRFSNKYPTYPIYNQNGLEPIGYLYSTEICVDCRLRGTNVMPDFWEVR
ncbi:DUF4249 domain-containing protein [Algoriphagus vanfongensis]|uniref:DUF4249 domain-containing protein n=1 Tax=Algoriphagus vanfongensis TaxID=426371 RepID=UPI00040FE647|nr:DUF4249 domain-containing protein [Algoriphagus vanfongensis]